MKRVANTKGLSLQSRPGQENKHPPPETTETIFYNPRS